MPSIYTGIPTNDPDSVTIPSDGDPPTAASVNAAFEGLSDQVAYLHHTAGPLLVTADQNITWQTPVVRVPTLLVDVAVVLVDVPTPRNGATVRFTRTQVDPDFTFRICRVSTATTLCIMPIITVAPNDGEQSWVLVEWTGLKWQVAGFSNNVTDIIDEA